MDHIKPVWATIEADVGPEAGISPQRSASSAQRDPSETDVVLKKMRMGPRHKARHANSLDTALPLKHTLNNEKCDYYCLMRQCEEAIN